MDRNEKLNTKLWIETIHIDHGQPSKFATLEK
jgi:hypothetical protein